MYLFSNEYLHIAEKQLIKFLFFYKIYCSFHLIGNYSLENTTGFFKIMLLY